MFDGIARVFRNKSSRAWRLYYAIDQLIRQKRASGEAPVVGHIVSQFLLRRCFLSALSEVWGHIESILGHIKVMPPRVVAELRCCAGLILICRHRADRPVSSTDYLTDASTHGYTLLEGGPNHSELVGACRRRELWRFSAEPSESLGLFSEARRAQLAEPPDPLTDFDCWVDSFPPPATPLKTEVSRTPAERKRRRIFAERVGVVPRLTDPFSSHTNWHRVLAGARARDDAIHSKEASVSALALQRALRRPHDHGHVILGIGDNLAEILASEKGRSKDRELNAVLRRAAACQEAGDFMWKRRHVVSEKNFADFDSRLADEGLLIPGECLHPSQLLRRLSRDCRFRRDLGGTHPPALKPLPSFPEENQVPATAPAVPAPLPAATCTYDVSPCRARDEIPDVRLVSDTVHVPLQRRLSVTPWLAQCCVHAPTCSRRVPSLFTIPRVASDS